MAAAVIVKNAHIRSSQTDNNVFDLWRQAPDFHNLPPGSKLGGLKFEDREAFFWASELPILAKINAEQFNTVEEHEVRELIRILKGIDEKSQDLEGDKIRLEMIILYFMTQLDDAANDFEVDMLLKRFLDQDNPEHEDSGFAMLPMRSMKTLMRKTKTAAALDREHAAKELRDVVVTPHELHQCFLEDTAEFVMKRRKKRLKGMDVTRDLMVSKIAALRNQHDALLGFPVTIVYLVVFIILMQGHMRIFHRQRLETALETYVNGRLPALSMEENIDTLDSWWEWVEDGGTQAPFGRLKTSNTTGHPYCLVAARNMLLGDVMIRRIAFDGTITSSWLLTSPAGSEALTRYSSSSPTRFLDAAREAAEHLKDNGWSGTDIETFQLKFNTYNEYARMFALVEVTVPLRGSGEVVHKINADAVAAQAYPDLIIALTLDSVWMLIVLYLLIDEVRQLCRACRTSLYDYWWDLWNCIDWTNILCSAACCVLWVRVIAAMGDPNLVELLDDDFKVKVNLMDFSTMTSDALEKVNWALERLREQFIHLQWVLALNTGTIVLKFFKAFSANKRLLVVTNTFKVAIVDLVHFAIIFFSIFFPFCLLGHILFGSDIGLFSSLSSSLQTGWLVIMGEFEWYIEESPTFMTQLFPSGMPRILLVIWYFTFNFLVLLVLLNMLLAIIVGNYTKTTDDLEDDDPTLWEQVKEYRHFRRDTKDHIPLQVIGKELGREDEPAHGGQEVSTSSLKRAFMGMTSEQAEWMMEWLTACVEKEEKGQMRTRQEEIHQISKINAEKLTIIVEAEKMSQIKIDELMVEAQEFAKQKDKDRGDNDSSKLAKITAQVEQMRKDLREIKKQQVKTGERVDLLTASNKGAQIHFADNLSQNTPVDDREGMAALSTMRSPSPALSLKSPSPPHAPPDVPLLPVESPQGASGTSQKDVAEEDLYESKFAVDKLKKKNVSGQSPAIVLGKSQSGFDLGQLEKAKKKSQLQEATKKKTKSADVRFQEAKEETQLLEATKKKTKLAGVSPRTSPNVTDVPATKGKELDNSGAGDFQSLKTLPASLKKM